MNNLNDNAYLRRRIDLQDIVSQPCMVALRNFSHAYLVSESWLATVTRVNILKLHLRRTTMELKADPRRTLERQTYSMARISRKDSFKSRRWRRLQDTEEWIEERERLLSPLL